MEAIRIQRNIKAPLAQVYLAWTQPALLQEWFFPGKMTCEAKCDFKVGGQYRLVMRNENGEFSHYGEYREIVDQEKIVFTWNSHNVSDTLVSVSFSGNETETQLVLVHELIQDPELRKDHLQGWKGCLDNLQHFTVDRTAKIGK